MILCALLLLAPVESDETADTIAALRAGLLQWKQGVEFRSTFLLKQGYAESVQAALREGIDSALNADTPHVFAARGVFHKKGDKLRMSLDYGHDPVVVGAPLGKAGKAKATPKAQNVGHTVSHVSFDEVTNGAFELKYYPGASGNSVVASPNKTMRTGAGSNSAVTLNPLAPYENPRFDPFKLWDTDSGSANAATLQSISMNADRTLDVILSRSGQWKQQRRIRFDMDAVPPVIIEIDETMTSPEGRVIEAYSRLTNFVQCPGGLVARSVRSLMKSGKGYTLVREWSSTDLGSVPPNDGDFVLEVPATTAIGGLANPPTSDSTGRRIDVGLLSEKSVIPPAEPGRRGVVFRDTVSKSTSNWLTLIVNVVFGVVILGLIVFLLRRRRRLV
jgi:hypothetical protein